MREFISFLALLFVLAVIFGFFGESEEGMPNSRATQQQGGQAKKQAGKELTAKTFAGSNPWSDYIYQNLNPTSVTKFEQYRNVITFFRYKRCDNPLLAGRTTPSHDYSSASIGICPRVVTDRDLEKTLAHEIDHAHTMITSGNGYRDDGTAVVDECKQLQFRYPVIFAKSSTCGMPYDDLVNYGRKYNGAVDVEK